MKLIFLSLLFTGLSWGAAPRYFINPTVTYAIVMKRQTQQPLNWKLGDTNTYFVGVPIAGAELIESVYKIKQEGIWIQQYMKMGHEKQVAYILYDQRSGAVKKVIVDGKEEPSLIPSGYEILESSYSKITVPAGSFDCYYAKIKDKQSGVVSNIWFNPDISSIGGLLRYDYNLGYPVVLTSFVRN